MKRNISTALILSTALSLAAGPAWANESSVRSTEPDTVDPRNMLLFNPGDLINGIVSVEYERALDTWLGFTLGVSVLSFRGVFTPSDQYSYVALLPEVGVRFHFIQDAPGGFWVGPYVAGGYVVSRSGATASRSFGYGLGGALGYNFILGRHFTFQIGVGSGFNDFGDGLAFAPHLRLGLGGVF